MQEEKAGDGCGEAESKTNRSPSLPQQTRVPPTPARTMGGVKTKEAASAVSAPSHTVGLPARKVIALVLTYTPCFGH